MEAIKWEYGVIAIPMTADFVASLNKAGEDGWEAWCVLGADQETARVGLKRPARLITLSTDVPSTLARV